MALLFLARALLVGIRAAHRQLLSLLPKLLNGSFEMLAIVGKFALCAFIAEELDLAVGEFRREFVFVSRFLRSEELCFGNKSDGNTLDTFGMTEVG